MKKRHGRGLVCVWCLSLRKRNLHWICGCAPSGTKDEGFLEVEDELYTAPRGTVSQKNELGRWTPRRRCCHAADIFLGLCDNFS